jgi:hypothetical protein
VIPPIETHFDGYLFRSRTEARWAVFFKAASIRYEYEKEGYALPSGWYLPDFWLPDFKLWFEVKGEAPTALESRLLSELCLATGREGLLAISAPTPAPQMLHFLVPRPDDCGGWDAGERWYLCDDRRYVGQFWLMNDDLGAYHLGPDAGDSGSQPDHGKYPAVHSATARGYAAARSARFERR